MDCEMQQMQNMFYFLSFGEKQTQMDTFTGLKAGMCKHFSSCEVKATWTNSHTVCKLSPTKIILGPSDPFALKVTVYIQRPDRSESKGPTD